MALTLNDTNDKPADSFKSRAGAWLIHKVFLLLWRTCRVTRCDGQEHAQEVLDSGRPFLPCYWHQMHVFGAWFLFDLKKQKDYKLGFLISPSADGDIAARVANRLGGNVVRGSSSHTGARALKDCFEAITRNSISLVFTADGPRGPLHEFKSGPLMLARMTGAPILPLGYRAHKAWRLNSWDRFIVPKPFSKIELFVGRPFWIEKDIDMRDLENKRIEVEAILRDLVPE